MKSSLIILAGFILGCLAGLAGIIPESAVGGNVTEWILYLLLLQVGLGLGSDPQLISVLKSVKPRLLLLPLATITGGLAASFLISFAISSWTPAEVMAVGSGFGYYSLSSILITSLKEASIGARAAAELGTIALIANIFREMMTLLFAPQLVRFFGPVAPIAAGGATTADVTITVIARTSGNNWIIASILHGILVDFSVPFLVSFFCSLG